MVFQNYALYPHMSVRENIEFPLRMRGIPRGARRRQVDRVAELLELGDLLDRLPAQLSGGQRQRLALAPALIREPALFLLDQPLSNLDVRLWLSVRQYVREVQRRLGVTTLYVAHGQTEAMTLGDRVVVMHRGMVQQVGTPATIYERPANAFVASFVSNPPMNPLPGAHGDGVLQVEDQRLPLGPEVRSRAANLGPRLLVGVRPEAFDAGREGTAPGLRRGFRPEHRGNPRQRNPGARPRGRALGRRAPLRHRAAGAAARSGPARPASLLSGRS